MCLLHYKKTVNYMEIYLRISIKIRRKMSFPTNFHTKSQINLLQPRTWKKRKREEKCRGAGYYIFRL